MRTLTWNDLKSKPLEQALRIFPGKTDQTIAETPMFLITGLGRSGTVFLAELLDLIPNYAVYHETAADRDAMTTAYQDSAAAYQYLRTKRRFTVTGRILTTGCITYGEVNSYLRYHVEALMKDWNVTILHLVRDGRDVVRSMMNRQTYTERDSKHSGRITPRPDDPWYEAWPTMDRFARLCWYWSATNEHLLRYRLSLIRFEDIISCFDKFENQVMRPINAYLPYEVWDQRRQQRRNVSEKPSFPKWPNWTTIQQECFNEICGATMARLNYH